MNSCIGSILLLSGVAMFVTFILGNELTMKDKIEMMLLFETMILATVFGVYFIAK